MGFHFSPQSRKSGSKLSQSRRGTQRGIFVSVLDVSLIMESILFRYFMSSIADKQERLLEDLAIFQDWTERYEYVIGLGKKLESLADEARDTDHLIKGCQSQVWLDAVKKDGRVYFYADSDSLITKGMIALFIGVLNGEKPDDILTADMSFIEKTGLKEHLAPTRANALNLMATQMKQRALVFAG
jgi:cysteine desulfuration protein SufE